MLLLITLFLSISRSSAVAGPLFDSFLKTVEKVKPRSLDAAISLLPPTSRAQFTLAFDSRGLQSSSYANPRAILFGANAQIIYSFTASQGKEADESIEVLEFNQATNEFEFFTLPFPLSFSSSGQLERPAKNPMLCMSCHGLDPTPIWGKAGQWTGMYGEKNDVIGSSDELAQFQKFIRKQKQSDRYRQLLVNSSLEYYPFSAPGSVSTYAGRPNRNLGLYLNRWSARRMADRLQRSPLFPRYSLLLLQLILSPAADQESGWSNKQEDKIWMSLQKDFGKAAVEKAQNAYIGNRLHFLHLYFLLTGLAPNQTCSVQASNVLPCMDDGVDGEEYKVAALVANEMVRAEPRLQTLFAEHPLPDFDSSDVPAKANAISISIRSKNNELLRKRVAKQFRL